MGSDCRTHAALFSFSFRAEGSKVPPPTVPIDSQSLTAKSTLSLLVGADGAQKVYPTELRPEDICKIELAVGVLPEQETRKMQLATGADNEIGFGQVNRVKMPRNLVWSYMFQKVIQRHSSMDRFLQHGFDGIVDLLATTIGNRDIQPEGIKFAGRGLRLPDRMQRGRRQQFQSAHCLNAYFAFLNDLRGHNAIQFFFEYGKDRGYLTRRTVAQIICRQNPNGNKADGQVITPLQNIDELFGAKILNLVSIGNA